MSLTLVILAAGMGSRYGGLKQLDAVGPNGEVMLDYAIFDAIRAGFDRVVFVIRRDFEAEFRRRIGARYADRVRVDYAFQALDALPAGFAVPAGRVKPWGTGHAVWCARAALDGPFAAINADDFYGRDSFARLAGLLRAPAAGAPRWGMVGFQLDRTLSEHGAVARGVCRVGGDGRLLEVVERTGIRREAVGPGHEFSGREVVSMNCWGLTPVIFALLGRQFADFLSAHRETPSAEFYLPSAISTAIAAGAATVQVLPTPASWFGITYREDKPRVVAAIRELVLAGEYPVSLAPLAADASRP